MGSIGNNASYFVGKDGKYASWRPQVPFHLRARGIGLLPKRYRISREDEENPIEYSSREINKAWGEMLKML